MKKYTLFLLAFVFIFSLFTLNLNSALADDSGCTSAGPYSTTTGQLCTTNTAVVCPKGDLFSSATGQPCTTWQDSSSVGVALSRQLGIGSKGDDVKALQQMLKDGGFLSGKVDGIYGHITGTAVTGYQKANSISATGKVDAGTLTKINAMPSIVRFPPEPCIPMMGTNGVTTSNCNPMPTPIPYPCPLSTDATGGGLTSRPCPPYPYPCPLSTDAGSIATHPCPPYPCPLSTDTSGTAIRICPPYPCPLSVSGGGAGTGCPIPIPNPQSPVISGVSGPQSLDINQQGTWTVTASDPMGGNLSYSVNWGDQLYALNGSASPTASMSQQSATFTHSYTFAGTFTPMFTVTNSNGGSAHTSLSVNVGNITTSPSLSVLSPNGGETWAQGTMYTIKWQDNSTWPPCPSGMGCMRPQRLYDITLQSFYPPCTTSICPMYPIPAPRTIAKNVTGSSYDWTIQSCGYPYPCSLESSAVAPGPYTIQVCQSGSATCDSSDSYFKIISGTTTGTNNLYINPASATVHVGTTAIFQALLSNCPAGAQCFVGPLPVSATWTSSNPNVARIERILSTANVMPCPSTALCAPLGSLSAVATGVSAGDVTITATYQDSAGNTVKTASAIVTVS